MPSFKLDGREIDFQPGETIIRAAWRQGIEIPHYCWHPGLSIAANCRMCLVEVKAERQVRMPTLRWDDAKQEYVPDTKIKLVPACQTPAADGMEVFAANEAAKTAQSAVQEFLLLNHPVDCPICDQAGECKLQDYWLTSQGKLKRKKTEPVHKPKGVRFGPTIVYDAERCIMCTRCIRVCDEVAHDHALDMRERGNKNEIVLSPGRELDHKYTLMTEHVCPVGALTSRDFRFKARVWFLRTARSVCNGCATGCNSYVDYDPRHGRVYRLRPRDNAEVNQFWMCDDGMMTYQQVYEERLQLGAVREAGEMVDATAPQALAAGVEALRSVDGSKIAVVLSAQHSSEDNLVLAKLASEVLGTSHLYVTALGGWDGDDILRHADNNPNRAGVEQVAGKLPGLDQLVRDADGGKVEAALVLGSASALAAEQLAPLAQKLSTVVTLATHKGPLADVASVVIPVACHLEMQGTFVNYQGRAQRFGQAVAPPEGVRPAWTVLLEMGRDLGKDLGFTQLGDVRKALTPPAQAAGMTEASV